MRVIAGRLGGRRLRAPAGRVTRPTSDRVKEAVFAMLGDVEGLRVLDLFAGTGALGIEALSRGAKAAVFVERDAAALKVLSGNLTALGIAAELVEVRRADALDALRAAASRQETYDLVFIDPPYGRTRPASPASAASSAERWGPELSAILPSLLSPGAHVVVESDRRVPLELPHTGTGELLLERHKRYGDTSITIHRHQ
jgi:16S rRNA (guanine966-N2)-methyltransferase